MTTHKEALKLALEALEVVNRIDLRQVNEASAAIKEALAQPEQEPVAHVSSVQSNSPLMCGLSEWERQGLVAIYTTPPQRKPLTDKQLNIIGSRWHLNLLGSDEKAELFAFARAIEAAHGITSKE